ncbi:hypothetical protein HY633_05295 [Candidatus Uhrbacteria bacterium]|nr:hypothetical protein [Candidatus Uhrbacteria bacterium]
MAKTPEFGFECGHFSVALSAEKIVIPGSKGTLKKSMLPMVAMDDVAGAYELTMRCDDATIYKAVVQVLWLGHRQEARRSDLPGARAGGEASAKAGGPTGREKSEPE